MGREDDDSHSNLFGRLVKSDSESDSSKRSGSGFNGSFSASASSSSSTGDPSQHQPDRDSAPTTKYTMFGPFEIEFGWPNERSMASVALSSYSPLALRDMPQPRPSDAPSNLDASIFTFEDAFEDLLAVSQGQPLPDITTRYEQRKLLRSMFPSGEPAWFWMRRLRSQGLLEDTGPSQWMKSANHNWEQFHRELDRRAANVWRAAMGEEEQQDRFHGHNPLLEDSEQHRQRRREPDNFDEFFNSVQSSFSEAQSTWDSFVKSITEGHPSSLDRGQQSDKPADDEKRVVTKDEYVDRFGYLHSKTTVKTLDEEGNEIGSETHYTVRPAEKDGKNAEPNEQAKDGEGSGIKTEGRVETKAGWFWK
ncbi:hypothetical protein CEP52_010885 [Fusarium oligoseptatum]|uniref:Uncharacterized protein n=1 Tax=Fusarium oligoseptatum TaxID=2604345 RepID=A0A428T5Y0_9HYPO|nr:hypothetical protein CEP52_010885 [Fusarium oligoseptatum]